MIKVGVTGSNGFIGWHLCRTLELDNTKFELIEFKRDWFNDSINLDNFVSKCNIVVHLAGLNRHSEDAAIYNTNVALAEKLVESFKRTDFKGQVISNLNLPKESLVKYTGLISNNLFDKKYTRQIYHAISNNQSAPEYDECNFALNNCQRVMRAKRK